MINRYGGVLEHPAQSTLWKEENLPKPGTGDKNGFSISIDQCWWGHPARKSTWLYIVGIDPGSIPDYSPSFIPHTHKIAHLKRAKKKTKVLPKRLNSHTPEKFAIWLIEIVKLCKESQNITK